MCDYQDVMYLLACFNGIHRDGYLIMQQCNGGR